MKYTSAILAVLVVCLLGAFLSKQRLLNEPLGESDQAAAAWKVLVDGVKNDLRQAESIAQKSQSRDSVYTFSLEHDDARKSDSIKSPDVGCLVIQEWSSRQGESSDKLLRLTIVARTYKFGWAGHRWQYLESAAITKAGSGEGGPVVCRSSSNLADWEKFLFRSAL